MPSETPHNQALSQQTLYRFDGYELDRLQWQLRYGGEIVPLNRKSFDLLLYLVEARPRVVSKDELMNALWPDQFVEENNLAQQVSLLRKSLAKNPDAPKLIETVPGRGYQFTGSVIESPAAKISSAATESVMIAETSYARIVLEEEVETPSALVDAPLALPRPPGRNRWIYASAIAGLLVLGAAGFFAWQWWQNRAGGPPVEVLLTPLAGTTGDTALDGVLGDAIRFDLSQSPVVTVASRTLIDTTLQQMQRKPGEPLTPPVAREVCERINGQAVVDSRVARTGQHFLLTGEAVSCVDGSTIVSDTAEAVRPEDLRGVANRLIQRIREKLGESRASIARFNTPVIALDTASLDALKASGAGNRAFRQGKWAEAADLYKRAIALDPHFAAAYYNLSAVSNNLNDEEGSRAAMRKAYELRNYSSPLMQFTISSRYEQVVTGNLYQAEKDDVTWTQLYPRDSLAWNQLASVRENLGEWARAAEAARKEVEISPDDAYAQDGLAQDLVYAGDLPGAREHAERALTIVPDFASSYVDLARIAVSTQDQTLFQRQLDWLAHHPDSPLLLAVEAELAIGRGRFADAMHWVQMSDDAFRRQSSADTAAEMTKLLAMEMIGAGDEQDGMALYRKYPVNAESPTELFTQAMAGDGAKAEASLKVLLAKQPEGTKLRFWYAPLIQGWSALKSGRTQDAVKVLTQPGTLPYYGDQDYARGVAYLQAGQPHEAEAAFRSLTDHPYRDQTYLYAASWVGLARALTAQGDRAGAAKAYARFFEIWKDADAGALLYQTAKSEAAALAAKP